MSNMYPLLDELGLEAADVLRSSATLTIDQKCAVVSSRYTAETVLPVIRMNLQSLRQLSTLVARLNPDVIGRKISLASLSEDINWDSVSAATLRRLRTGLTQHVINKGTLPENYSAAIEKYFFPMPISVIAAEDVYVKSGCVFTIEPDGHDPVVCDFGMLTLEEGGQVKIEAPALISINTFIKKPSS